jgi:hypothetical protein
VPCSMTVSGAPDSVESNIVFDRPNNCAFVGFEEVAASLSTIGLSILSYYDATNLPLPVKLAEEVLGGRSVNAGTHISFV